MVIALRWGCWMARRWSSWVVLASLAMLAMSPPALAQDEVDHGAWDDLLKRHVAVGLVEYRGFRGESEALKSYLASLKDVDPATLGSPKAQMAFWINAYNAWVVHGVLNHYPLRSVKGVRGFFDGIRYRVAGRELTLNEMEDAGRALGDLRIHFALVCASSSCPRLRAEAYLPEFLDEQLNEQARKFLNDPSRGLRIKGGTLFASKIFKWYSKDFLPTARPGLVSRLTAAKLLSRLESHLEPTLAQAAQGRKLGLRFMKYNWSLNEQTR